MPKRCRAAPARQAVVLSLLMTLAAGCAGPVRFPAEPTASRPAGDGTIKVYDTDGDSRTDYGTMQNLAGRTVRIGYDTTGNGEADSLVDLDQIAVADCRHVVLIIDGVGYDTVKAFQEDGGLRLFHPPAAVISTFPAMTEIALNDIFQTVRCRAGEAVYFNHQTNRLEGGDGDYLAMENEDWVRCTDYRAGTLVDPLAYLFPGHYFKEELAEFRKRFDRRDRPRFVAYFVSTAGLGTRDLLDGQHEILRGIDRLVEELVWKTRGLVKVTLLSDHGHTLVRGKWIDFRAFLREKGWNVRDRLDGPRDVAPIEYGLTTYASYATRDREALATTLIEHEGVDLVTYARQNTVVVEGAAGKAVIERRGDRYRYRAESGDPLRLAPIIAKAETQANVFDSDGFADGRVWLALTATHAYPDALDRLWRAFRGQTEHVPDLLASLKEGYNAGLKSRAWRFPDGASTHGDLGRKSSTAFIMSTTCPIRRQWQPLRCRDLPGILDDLTGRPWPPARKEDR